MIFVSLTRLRLRSFKFLPMFVLHTLTSVVQSKRSLGHLTLNIRKSKGLTFWTLSSWEDKESMMVFFASGAHKKAMPKLKHWCDEASFTNWTQDSNDKISWDFAEKKLQDNGRLSKVLFPSSIQSKGEINIS